MRILDVDLDFFLDGIENWADLRSEKRLDSESYAPDTPSEVKSYLSENCGLDSKNKLKGKFVKHHDEVFYELRKWIETGIIVEPFELVHIDAHADMGLGDCSYIYIMTELIHEREGKRLYPDDNQINPGNYLIYLVISKWLRELTYVHHPRTFHLDYPHRLFRGGNGSSGIIEVRKYAKGTKIHNMNEDNCIGIDEPFEVKSIRRENYLNTEDFDFVFLAQSPGFTPRESDELIEVFKEYIDFD